MAQRIRDCYSLSEDDVRPAIMGEKGSDIKLSTLAKKFFPCDVEAKNVERINVWSAYDQGKKRCVENNLTPLLFIKRNHSRPLVILDADCFFILLQSEGPDGIKLCNLLNLCKE